MTNGTGPKGGGRVNPKSLDRLEKTDRALELRRCGHTYREIARELRITLRQAHKLVTDAFKATQRHAKEQSDELVQIQSDRLEAMYKALAPKLEKGGEGLARAIEVGIKVLERQAKLHGLDQPAKQETTVTYHHLSDAELIDEARKLRLDVHLHPPQSVLLPGETDLPPALRAEVTGLLTGPTEPTSPTPLPEPPA